MTLIILSYFELFYPFAILLILILISPILLCIRYYLKKKNEIKPGNEVK